MRHATSILLGVCCIGFCGCSPKQNAEAERLGASAAQRWLELIDTQNYAASWEQAAGLFKSAISQDSWTEIIQVLRKPVGGVIQRKVTSKTYLTSGHDAPGGEYVRIQYDTEFENKKTTIETVVSRHDSDDRWRVSAYLWDGRNYLDL